MSTTADEICAFPADVTTRHMRRLDGPQCWFARLYVDLGRFRTQIYVGCQTNYLIVNFLQPGSANNMANKEAVI
jgi:hypothetical protein